MKWLTQKPDRPIDWSLRQWVRLKEDHSFIVITTGKHGDNEFSGMALPCNAKPYGHFSIVWNKSVFELVPGVVMFPISNAE